MLKTLILKYKINKFYRDYNLETETLADIDIYNYDDIMTVYDNVWHTMEYYDPRYEGYAWLSRLYDNINEFMQTTYSRPFKIVDAVIVKRAIIKMLGGIACAVGMLTLIGMAGADFVAWSQIFKGFITMGIGFCTAYFI